MDGRHLLYAVKATGEEYYEKKANGTPFYGFSVKNQKEVYVKDSRNDQIYPTLEDGNQILAQTNYVDYYVKDASSNEIYPKNERRWEHLLVPNTYAVDAKGEEYYPRKANGFLIYPANKLHGGETYLLTRVNNTRVIFGKHALGDEIYAKDAEEDYYQPPTEQYVRTIQSLPYQAATAYAHVIFKKNDRGDEEYLEYPSGTFEPLTTIPRVVVKRPRIRYAKTVNGREIYPFQRWNGIRFDEEIDFMNKYALDENCRPYYPVDRFGNEYVLPVNPCLRTIREILPRGYPADSSGFLLLPVHQGDPVFLADDGNDTADDIVETLTFATH